MAAKAVTPYLIIEFYGFKYYECKWFHEWASDNYINPISSKCCIKTLTVYFHV